MLVCHTDSQMINSHSCFPIYPFNPFPWMLDVTTRLLYLGPPVDRSNSYNPPFWLECGVCANTNYD